MGPTDEALALARFLLFSYPQMTCTVDGVVRPITEIELAYVLDSWAEDIDRRD